VNGRLGGFDEPEKHPCTCEHRASDDAFLRWARFSLHHAWLGGLSPEQRFFVGFAQWACENQRPENARLLAITDSHSPSRWRVNGVVANMPEFERAFACRSGQPMAPQNRCRVW